MPRLPECVMHDELHRLHLAYRARKRRLKRLLKPLPRRANVTRYPVVKWFAQAAHRRPYLWSFKRAHVLPSLYVGSVLSLLPLYGIQLVLAFGAALAVRGNLTVMAALQLVTNPFTVGPLYFGTYLVGQWIIDHTGFGLGAGTWGTRINALFIGGVVCGLAMALVVDVVWRVAAWEARRFRARHAAVRAAMAEHARAATANDPARP